MARISRVFRVYSILNRLKAADIQEFGIAPKDCTRTSFKHVVNSFNLIGRSSSKAT